MRLLSRIQNKTERITASNRAFIPSSRNKPEPFSHGEKAQTGTPADCLDFPRNSLLDVGST